MENTKPSKAPEQMRRLSDFMKGLDKDSKNRSMLTPMPLTEEFGVCQDHSKYPKYTQGQDEVVRALKPGCPACNRAREIARLLSDCNIPERFVGCDFSNYKPETHEQGLVLAQCQSYADSFYDHLKKGTCLLLCGDPGTGKNHLATAITKQLLKDRYTVLRVKATQYLDAYWSKGFNERESWLSGMAKVDLLMIDEVGRSSDAKAAKDALFRLIDARYEAQSPTLIATNLNRDELIDVLGDATYDRLSGGIRLTFGWDSYRKKVV